MTDTKRSQRKGTGREGSSRSLKPSKLEAYKDLYGLNLAIGIIQLKCEQLQARKTFPPGLFARSRELAKELRAEITHKLAETLNARELKEDVHFVRLRSQQDLRKLKKSKMR